MIKHRKCPRRPGIVSETSHDRVLNVLDERCGVECSVEDVAHPEHEPCGAAECWTNAARDHKVRAAALHLAVGDDGRKRERCEHSGGEGEGDVGEEEEVEMRELSVDVVDLEKVSGVQTFTKNTEFATSRRVGNCPASSITASLTIIPEKLIG